MMGIKETTAQTIDGYVSIAIRAGRDAGWRAAIAAKIKSNKHRVYRDAACIAGLEDFLRTAVDQA
jgi:protein O-GlcNAc transferase